MRHDPSDRRRATRRPPRTARRPSRLRAVRAHQHRRPRGDGRQHDRLRQRAPRTDRRPCRRRLRPCHRPGVGGPQPPQPRTHQRRHRRRQRRPRLHPDGRHRRRRAVALLRPAPAPGGQPPRRRLPSSRSTDRSSSGPGASTSAELLPEIIDKAFLLAENGQPGPVLVDVPMDVFSQPVDPRCSPASTTAPRRCTSRRSTTRRPRRSSPASPRPSAR